MIVTSGLLVPVSRMFKCLRIGDIIKTPAALYLQIDSDKSNRTKLTFRKNPHYNQQQWLKIALIFTSAILMAVYRLNYEIPQGEDRIMCLWTIGFLTFCYFHAWFCNAYAVPVSYFFNQLGKFERRYIANVPDRSNEYEGSKLTKKLISGLTSTMMFNSVFGGVSAVISPSASWNVIPVALYSYLQISSLPPILVSGLQIGAKLMAFSFCYTLWRYCSKMGMVTCNLCMLTGSFCLTATLIQLERMIAKLNRTPNQDFSEIVQAFREIQLLCKIYNDIHASTIFQYFVVVVPTTFATSLFILVTNGKTLNMQMIMQFFNFLVTMAGVTLLVFGQAVSVNSRSRFMKISQCRGELVKFLSRKERKQIRLVLRYWWSMPTLKICFFSSNFFEKKTPLVLLDLGIGLAINLILVKSK